MSRYSCQYPVLRSSLNRVTGTDYSTPNHSGKDSLFGHDTFTYLPEDSATGSVALFTNLRNLQRYFITHGHSRPRYQREKLDAFGGDIFSEVTGTDLKAHVTHLVDAFRGQQADLPVSITVGMGVVFKAIHIKLDKLFALKMIAPGLAMNENFIKRFQIEAKALAKF